MAALDLGAYDTNNVNFVICRRCNHVYAAITLADKSLLSRESGTAIFECPKCGLQPVDLSDIHNFNIPGASGLLMRYIYALNTLMSTHQQPSEPPSKRPHQ